MCKIHEMLNCISNGVKNCYLHVFKWGITSKLYKQELWFLYSIHRLMILNICMKFQMISLTVFMSSTDMILSQNCFLQSSKGNN